MAVLPQLDRCDEVKAANIRAEMDLNGVDVMPISADARPVADANFKKIYADVVSMLPCLKITCAELGGLRKSDLTFYDDFEMCTDQPNGAPKLLGDAAYT